MMNHLYRLSDGITLVCITSQNFIKFYFSDFMRREIPPSQIQTNLTPAISYYP